MSDNQSANSTVVKVDEFYELVVGTDISSSSHYNDSSSQKPL